MTPYLAGNIIDGLIDPSRRYYVYLLPLAPAFFFFSLWVITQFIVQAIDWYLNLKNRYLEERIFANYLVGAMSHVIELPISFHKEKKIGDVQNRFYSAADSLSVILTNVAITLLPQFLSIIIALFVTFFINSRLSLLLAISMLFYFFILIMTGPKYTKLIRRMRRAFNRAFGDAYDTMVNTQSVKQAGAERYEKKVLYRNFHLRALKYWEEMQFVWQIMNYSQRVLVALTQSAIYLLSIYFITQGTMTIGQLVMFNGYVALFLGPFVILANNWHLVQNGLVNLERAEKILSEETEDYEGEDTLILSDIKGKIEFRNVSFAYEKGRSVLKNISFSVKPGEVVAFVGESGVGKTTIIDLISRYIEPTKGNVFIDGHTVSRINLRFLRSKIAVVPQEILLFNDTILNNIRYGSFNSGDKKVEEASKKAHADIFISRFPKKYKQIVGERGIKLSTGQKQRVAIARAILRDPRILILDEPTSALDAKSEKMVEEAFRELMKGRTTFIIAHRFSTVRHADKILVLEGGRIAESGTHEELMKIKNGVYQHLYRLQVGL